LFSPFQTAKDLPFVELKMSLQGLHLKTENKKGSIPQIEGIGLLSMLWSMWQTANAHLTEGRRACTAAESRVMF
jgi:hypothetical protein